MSFLPVPSTYRFLPLVEETVQPFQVDNNGAIATTVDPNDWARDHILALLLTSPGERVMRPSYGIGLRRFVFENNDPFVEAEIITRIQQGLALWEPDIRIGQIQIVPQPPDWSIFEFRMSYAIGVAPPMYSIEFSMNGQGVEVQQV